MESGPAGGMVLDVAVVGGGDMNGVVVGVVEVSGLVGGGTGFNVEPKSD